MAIAECEIGEGMSEPRYQSERVTLHCGDVLDVLRQMPEESVHCAVTSPPYWGLRIYPWGGDGSCRGRNGSEEHQWPELLPSSSIQVCARCGAQAGTLGLEATPEEYVAKMVEVFREVRRVLRSDGTCWVNLGDSYAGGNCGGGSPVDDRRPEYGRPRSPTNSDPVRGRKKGTSKRNTLAPGLKPKDLCGIPWRVAFALQADGWWLRSDMPWIKRSPMPESVTDRPVKALEYVFLLTKAPRYYFDMDAVRQKGADATRQRDRYTRILENDGPQAIRHDHETKSDGSRNWWNADLMFESLKAPHGMIFCGDEPVGLDVVPYSWKEAHFATFPPNLVRPMIAAGTSDKGCCPECGAPWRRVVEKSYEQVRPPRIAVSPKGSPHASGIYDGLKGHSGTVGADGRSKTPTVATIGWEPGCSCLIDVDRGWGQPPDEDSPDPVPCTVLDPFAGSGTTLLVARQMGRNSIGIDLSPEYCDMAWKRIHNPEPMPVVEDVPDQLQLQLF